MSDLLASIFGGGSQSAPVLPTFDPKAAQGQFLSQNFGKSQGISNDITKNTSAANLSAFTTGLNQINPGALTGINEEQTLGNSLLAGNMDALPSWARQYLNTGQRQGAENALGRGVGAFSDNGLSGVNQFKGQNAMNLVQLGANFSSQAEGKSMGIVDSTMYKNDPWSTMLTPGQFQQAGMFNTQIRDKQAEYDAAAANWNRNNSPLGSAIKFGMDTIITLAGDFLGGGGKAMMGGM